MIFSNRRFFLKKLALMFADLLAVICSLFLTLFLSRDYAMKSILQILPVFALVSLFTVFTVAYIFGVHRIAWRYAGFRDVTKLCAVISSAVVISLAVIVIAGVASLSAVEWICTVLLSAFLCSGARLILRHISVSLAKSERAKGAVSDYANTMIIGAGSAAEILVREILRSPSFAKCVPVAMIDDDPDKRGELIRGVPVVGDRTVIEETVQRLNISTIFFAIPSASKEDRRSILNICSRTGCSLHMMPSVDEALDNSDILSKVRKVRITDLLGRDMIDIDVNKILGYVENKTVLVTGGGGSIGSELCRQIAGHSPSKLIIFDIYENNAYDILNELKHNHPSLDVIALIGSVRDEERLNSVFAEYRPDIVYHAAAHKHVPLMEDSPHEAIKNNVFGTLNTVRAADKYGAKRFVMISTDKAVNPTNVMGATKRVCEMIVQTYNKKSNTEYVAVRFGNVLGSNGSVIPLFEKQIEAGGPVTVTHPDIIRYFMTIPEAVSLVLSAGASASGGEIFVLDMGEPVKIADLAENMIRLSGLEPYHDIDICFTGLRPGEKLYEELLMDEEGLTKTENSLIYIGKPIQLDEQSFWESLDRLYEVACDENSDVRKALRDIVPTYKESPKN